jgi:pentatricopeptide repeat protein
MKGYLQSKMIDEARRIFDGLEVRDAVCWNTMISGYVHCLMLDEAMVLFQQMPNKTLVSWNTMLAGYAHGRQMGKALSIFRKMNQRNVVSWNSVLSGLVQNGLYDEAIQHLVLMRRDTEMADWSTYKCCLSVCTKLADLQVVRQFHSLLVRSGYIGGTFSGNVLISAYGRCRRLSEARHVFDEMAGRDIVSWNALINGYASYGRGIDAVSVFREMEANDVRPDVITFVGVLSACSRAGLLDEGLDFFSSMTKDYSLQPVAIHYACMVDLLGRAGRLTDAFELIQGMQIQPDAGVWGALLGACRLHKNDELAQVAANKLLELGPRKSS